MGKNLASCRAEPKFRETMQPHSGTTSVMDTIGDDPALLSVVEPATSNLISNYPRHNG